MRQLKRIFLGAHFFEDLFSNRGHFNLHLDEVSDWKLHHFYHEPRQDVIWAVLESPEFEEVEEGAEIPVLDFEMQIRRVTFEAA